MNESFEITRILEQYRSQVTNFAVSLVGGLLGIIYALSSEFGIGEGAVVGMVLGYFVIKTVKSLIFSTSYE